MPKFFDMEQGTPEWLKIHAGRITGSRMRDLMNYSKTAAKSGNRVENNARADYRDELVAERLTGQMSQHFVTEQMKRGTAEEGYARSTYEVKMGVMVEPVGFAIHPTFDFCGASPDGYIDGRKIIEIKNLTTVNHLYVCRTRIVPSEYFDQMLWTMRCCEVEEGDFISCDSRLFDRAPHLELLVLPVKMDEKRIQELEAEAVLMNEQIEEAMSVLTGSNFASPVGASQTSG